MDYRGLFVHAFHADGSRETLEVSSDMLQESDLQASGTSRRSFVAYEGKKLTFEVPLRPERLEGIQVFADQNLSCFEGQLPERSLIRVQAQYSDGSVREVSHYRMVPAGGLRQKDSYLAIRYGRMRASVPIRVEPLPEEDSKSEGMGPPADAVPQDRTEIPMGCPESAEPAQEAQPGRASRVVQSVCVSRPPDKLRYLVGDGEAVLQGGQLTVMYEDGGIEQIDMAADELPLVKSERVGPGMVTFSYGGKPVGFPIEVVAPQIVKLSIAQMPACMDYAEGDQLDLAGLVLSVCYNDGSRRQVRGLSSDMVITSGHALDGVTLAYEGSPFTIPIRVVKARPPTTVAGISIAKPPNQTSYIEGECLHPNLSGGELLLQLSDGRQELIPMNQSMVNDFDISRPGPTVLRLLHLGHQVSQDILVKKKSLENIVIGSPPRKTSYFAGERFDLYGTLIFAQYNNGSREAVADYSLQADCAAEGASELVFLYRGKQASVPITVTPISIVSLDWVQPPGKTVYETFEASFSPEGGVIRAKRNDGSHEDVMLQSDMVSGFDTSTAGPKVLRISCFGKALPLSITVVERTLLGLQVTSRPRTEYLEGESFDVTGLVVEARYSGGSTEQVSVTVSPYGPLSEGCHSVILIYEDKAVVLPVSVARATDPCLQEPPAGMQEPLSELSASKPSLGECPEASECADTSAARETEQEQDDCAEGQADAPERAQMPHFYPSTFSCRFQGL